MSLAAIYLRLSRNEEQLDIEEVLSYHKQALVKLADQHKLGYDIYQEVSSGINTQRPQLNRFLKQLEEYDYLLVMDIDRISRDNAFAEQIKTMLIAHDIKILTPQGEIDLAQESNEMLYSFQAMMANFEYKQIRKRLGRGRLAAAEQGRWVMSSRVPLGYAKAENQKLIIVEEEAKIIQYIFQKTLERFSANEIARQLDALGWRSRSGKVLTTSHISSIRRNAVYYGVVKASRRVNGRVVDKVFVENAHEAIIPKQQWLEVQTILQENKKNHFFNKKRAVHRLQNLIYCSCCLRKRYIQIDSTGSDYIKSCSYKVSNNKCMDKGYKYFPIEEYVLKRIKEKKPAFEKALQNLNLLDTAKEMNLLKEQMASLEKQKARFEKRQRNLAVMRMDGEISSAEFQELSDENLEKINKVQEQLNHITIQLDNMESSRDRQKQLKENLQTLDRIEKLEIEPCNTFLKSFIKKIWFSANTSANHCTKQSAKEPAIEIEWL